LIIQPFISKGKNLLLFILLKSKWAIKFTTFSRMLIIWSYKLFQPIISTTIKIYTSSQYPTIQETIINYYQQIYSLSKFKSTIKKYRYHYTKDYIRAPKLLFIMTDPWSTTQGFLWKQINYLVQFSIMIQLAKSFMHLIAYMDSLSSTYFLQNTMIFHKLSINNIKTFK